MTSPAPEARSQEAGRGGALGATSRACEVQPGLMLAGQRLEVRLVNGSDRCSGTVEVRVGGAWEPPCRALWDRSASEAACRALGCGGAERGPDRPTPLPLDRALGNASGTPNTTWALAPIVLCSSSEWQLCRVEQHLCVHDGQLAQVTCAGTARPGSRPPAPATALTAVPAPGTGPKLPSERPPPPTTIASTTGAAWSCVQF